MKRFFAFSILFSAFFCLIQAQDKPANPKALELFIEAKTFELKDNYLAAISKYNDALRIEKSPGIYYALSKLYSNVTQHQKALEYVLEAVKLSPANILYKEHLSDVYIILGDYNNALKYLKEVIQKNPDDINLLYNIGRMYEALKQPSEAIKYYENITENYQYDETVLLRMADIYESYNDYANTAATVEKLLLLNPTDINLKYSAAAAYVKIPDYDNAIRIYEEILSTNPNNRDVQTEVIKLYFRQHRNSEAFEKYSKMINRDSVDFMTKMDVAIAFFQASSEDKEALSVSKSILQTLQTAYPNEWMPEYYLAYIDSKENREMSEQKFNELLARVDTSAELYVQVGFYYYEKNKFQPAVDIFKKGAQKFPSDFRLNYLTGNTYYRLSQNREALPYLEKAVEISPSDLNALSNLGLVYDDLKMNVECDRLYRQALSYHPENILLLNNYAYHLAENNERLKEALEMSKKTIDKEPNNASYLDTYGWILYKLKDYKNAAVYIEKAIKQGKNATLLDHLGDIYEADGEIVKALKQWNEALQLEPENELVKKKIEKYK
ncbi:MAG: tetratricopeptide repeat protein [Chlorobi bacterium]|nr:tetratricopeptide repeat protein [Chlorobiota bacterium]MCI0715970.1 tetratricopeptide repeat protein [Chlorobiota bacterium]